MVKLISFTIDAQRFFKQYACLTGRLTMSGLRLSFVALMVLGVATLTLAQRPTIPTRPPSGPSGMMGGSTGRQVPGSTSQGFPNYPFPLSDDDFDPWLAIAYSLGNLASGRGATAGNSFSHLQALSLYHAL